MSAAETQKRRRHPVTAEERKAIRDHHRANPGLTQTELSQWAAREFGRHVSQSTISDSLKGRFAYVDVETPSSESVPSQPWGNGREEERGCAECCEAGVQCNNRRPCVRCTLNKLDCHSPMAHSFRTILPNRSRSRDPVPDEERTAAWDGIRVVRAKDRRPAAKRPSTARRLIPEAQLIRRADAVVQAALPKQLDPSKQWFTQLLSVVTGNQAFHNHGITPLEKICIYLDGIQARVGQNDALDKALRCLALGQLAVREGDENVLRTSRQSYVSALSSLQKQIDGPRELLNLDAVHATMILYVYELCACTTGGSWMNHSRGVAHLMHLLGNLDLQDRDRWNIFYAIPGQIWLHSYEHEEDIDFQNDQYRSALPTFTNAYAGAPCEMDVLMGKLYGLARDIPSHLRTMKHLDRDSGAKKAELIDSLFRLRNNLKTWELHFHVGPSPVESVPAPVPDPVFPTVFTFTSLCGCSTFSTYSSICILVNTLIQRLIPLHDYTEENLKLADNVCKSVGYAADAGFLGPGALGFALRVAYMVTTPEKQRWINEYWRYTKTQSRFSSLIPAQLPLPLEGLMPPQGRNLFVKARDIKTTSVMEIREILTDDSTSYSPRTAYTRSPTSATSRSPISLSARSPTGSLRSPTTATTASIQSPVY